MNSHEMINYGYLSDKISNPQAYKDQDTSDLSVIYLNSPSI